MNDKAKLKEYLSRYLNNSKTTAIYKAQSMNYEMEDSFSFESNISNYINENKEKDTFQTKLFNYIDQKELKDSDVYNKVYLDRRLFSKIRNNKDYHPSKETIILLGIALELTEEQLEDLLKSASYSLPMNTTYDLIIRFCFKEKIYDLEKVNSFLYDYKCKLLNI